MQVTLLFSYLQVDSVFTDQKKSSGLTIKVASSWHHCHSFALRFAVVDAG
jgi:hypothetical protein